MVSTVTFILGYLLAVVVYVVIESPFVGTSSDTVKENQAISDSTDEPAQKADDGHVKKE